VAPTGSVTVTVGGSAVNATLAADGSFTAVVPTSALAASGAPYAVTFYYAGSGTFTWAAASSTLRVVDTTAPAIGIVTTTPASLGAPDHKMIEVTVAYSVTDISGDPSCSVSVSSSEAVNGLGDGDTSIDWQVLDPHHVQLRAERSGTGSHSTWPRRTLAISRRPLRRCPFRRGFKR